MRKPQAWFGVRPCRVPMVHSPMPETMNSSRVQQNQREEKIMDRKTRRTRTFIGLMVLAAITAAVYAGIGSHALHPYYALAVLALAAATSRMRVKLPGIEGNMPVNLPFLLMAVLSVSAAEAVLIASFSTVVQCWPQSSGKFRPDQMLFNVSMLAFATSMASLFWNAGWLARASWASLPVVLAPTPRFFFSGTNRSPGGNHQTDSGRGHAERLDKHRETLIPLLRAEHGIDFHAQPDQPSLRLASGPGGFPGHVRGPSFLPVLLWPGRGSSSAFPPCASGKSGGVRSIDNAEWRSAGSNRNAIF